MNADAEVLPAALFDMKNEAHAPSFAVDSIRSWYVPRCFKPGITAPEPEPALSAIETVLVAEEADSKPSSTITFWQ